MERAARHDRTARLLGGRLEELALAIERAPARARDLEPKVIEAAAATRHAIELELLSPEEAEAIWADAARRHPQVDLDKGPRLAA